MAESKQNLAQNSFELSPLFIQISRDLLNETYALEHHFRALSLTEMGLILEEAPRLDTVDPESYEKCKSHYCMLLIELELAGHESIPELLNSHTLDSLVHPEAPQETDSPDIEEPLKPVPSLPPVAETVPPKINFEPLEDYQELNSAEEPEVATTQLISEFDPESAFAPLVPSEAETPDHSPTSLDGHSGNATVIMQPETDLDPIAPEELEEAIELTTQHDPKTLENAPVNPECPFHALKTHIAHSLSKNYLQLASDFHVQIESGQTTLSLVTLRKLVGQFLCSLAEVEIFSSVKQQIHFFWPNRQEAIESLVSEASFSLKPELIKHFSKYSEQYSDWLYEGRFPVASITRCLRVVLLTESPERFNPSCLELGALIYLFGHNSQDEKSNAVKNLMELAALPNKELVELCFRLSRLEFLKAKALDHYSHFDNDHVELISEDVTRTLELVRKMYPLEKDDQYFDENDIKDVA